MNNHWLRLLKKKKMFKEIDEIAMEVWSEDGTLADLFAALDDDQAEYLMNMALSDFSSDPDNFKFCLDLAAE